MNNKNITVDYFLEALPKYAICDISIYLLPDRKTPVLRGTKDEIMHSQYVNRVINTFSGEFPLSGKKVLKLYL